MAKSPELVQAYELIKAGRRDQAGQILKAYLANHPHDADGWWLMAHSVTKPENVQKCLERVLLIDPNHARAKAKLERMQPAAVPAEPDDAFFAVSSAQPARTVDPFTAQAVSEVDSFTTPPGIRPPSAEPIPGVSGPFTESWGSFDSDPFGSRASQTASQPGLAFVQDRPAGNAASDARPKPPRPKSRMPSGVPLEPTAAPKKQADIEMVIGVAVIAIALVVLCGVGLFFADRQGWIQIWGLPPMKELQATSFSFEYPKEWEVLCKNEQMGNQVCGAANDARFIQVDYYTGEVDYLGDLSDALTIDFFGASDPPDLVVSVIAMDVPENSPAYSDTSMAAMMNEWTGEYNLYTDTYKTKYDKREITVDGQKGYYYFFSMEDKAGALGDLIGVGGGYWALYDVYVPHGDKTFWMTVQTYSYDSSEDIPDDIIQHIIESIQWK